MKGYVITLAAVGVIFSWVTTPEGRAASSSIDDILGVHPDCSQKPVSIDKLSSLAKNSSNMLEFLKSIPQGSLQNFTLVYNSQSIQRGNDKPPGNVSPLWPRAIRTSADGKLTLSFVCDPQNPAYGKIEAIYFDDSNNQLKTLEWDFSDGRNTVARKDRVQHPTSCLACHGGSVIDGTPTIRNIWPEYFFWSDCKLGPDRATSAYGSSDDSVNDILRVRIASSTSQVPVGCTKAADKAAHAAEEQNWKDFRERQQNNSCFNTLPWAKIPPSKQTDPSFQQYKDYPYRADTSGEDLMMRPNLHLTQTYARLAALKIMHTLKKNARLYNPIKYYLLMEAFGCLQPGDSDKIGQVLHKPISPTSLALGTQGDTSSGSDPLAWQPLLYLISREAGIQDVDWSLNLHPSDRSYDAADTSIGSLVDGDILRDVAATEPELSSLAEIALQPISSTYGAQNACVDKEGASIGSTINLSSQSNACIRLRQDAEKAIEDTEEGNCVGSAVTHPEQPTTHLIRSVSPVLNAAEAASALRGKVLIQADSKGKCVLCHSVGSGLPADLQFIPNPKAPAVGFEQSMSLLRSKAKEGFVSTLDDVLVKQKAMPPGGGALSDQDREDIEAYIASLVSQGDKH